MSIFVKNADVLDLLNNRLVTALRQFDPKRVMSESYLWTKLLAAEAEIAHDLHVCLEPTEILPFGYAQGEADVLKAAGKPFLEEPGYDYDPDNFSSGTWGTIQLRQRPVIAVHGIKFAYPSASQSLYDIPIDWIRLDKKYGTFALIPTQSAVVAPLSGFILSTLGGGNVLPYVLQIRYRCGIANARLEYPELVDLIFSRAALLVVADLFVPRSGSTSIDGMSQSLSFDIGKQEEAAAKRLESLRKKIHGIRLAVL